MRQSPWQQPPRDSQTHHQWTVQQPESETAANSAGIYSLKALQASSGCPACLPCLAGGSISVYVGVCRSGWLLKLVLKLMLMPRSTCYARHGLLWAASVLYPGMTAIKAICGPSSS